MDSRSVYIRALQPPYHTIQRVPVNCNASFYIPRWLLGEYASQLISQGTGPTQPGPLPSRIPFLCQSKASSFPFCMLGGVHTHLGRAGRISSAPRITLPLGAKRASTSPPRTTAPSTTSAVCRTTGCTSFSPSPRHGILGRKVSGTAVRGPTSSSRSKTNPPRRRLTQTHACCIQKRESFLFLHSRFAGHSLGQGPTRSCRSRRCLIRS
ncbi:hypothetical protein BD309DRAFT_960837 [Dichomitus squalens]|uniref:Uncharacterized protein n=1 Tax=Dichomitus squalens TaxID=114155 RepID=A0A4Q9NTI2_9APHY|nr:hypothetical protein BD309DRAFT_960837 [Dichomitus squalens]TBU58226.1 hypothetical protein BD310DRAFT_494562 [Dichomitus squalens]